MGLPRHCFFVAAPLMIVAAIYLVWSRSQDSRGAIDGGDAATISDAARYWKEALAQGSMPTVIRDMVSPLSPPEAARIAGLIQQPGRLSRDAAAAVCAAAGLSCAGATGEEAEEEEAIARRSWNQSMSEMYFTEHSLLTDPDRIAAPNWVVTLGGAKLKRPLLPRAVAQALELVTGTGPDSEVEYSVEAAMRELHIDPASEVGRAMESTRAECARMSATHSRQSACAFSPEDLADSLAALLRPKEQGLRLDALASSSSSSASASGGSSSSSTAFRLLHSELKVGENGHLVTCHALPFPSQALMCHTAGNTKVYETTLRSTDAQQQVVTVKQLVVCHADTGTWTVQNPILQALRLKPGQSVVCHWGLNGLLVIYAVS